MAALLVALSLAQHASLLAQLHSSIASDLGDPLLNTWILWWNAQRIPLTDAYWNAPSFAPAPNTFALSETLLGLTWLTTPLQWLGATPLLAYNVMFIAEPVLNGLSAFWLCLTLTGRRDAALIGALAFAFAPYHASQLSHLQTRAMFFMPMVLVGLHRYWTTRDRRWLALSSLAMLLNGLVCGYFLLYFSVLVGLAIVWLTVASRDLRRGAAATAAIAIAVVLMWPVIATYRGVQRELNLRRSINDIEQMSADLSSIGLGSPHLAAWPLHTPLHRPERAGYPGIVIAGLIGVAAVVSARDRRKPIAAQPWRRRLVLALGSLSVLVVIAGLVVVATGGVSYKVFGIALDIGLLAALMSARFTSLIRSGSIAGLYATGVVVSSMLALGNVGRVAGHRFWYKPPFAWLMTLPGFDSSRVPALFSLVCVVCLAVLAALAIRRLWPAPTRASMAATVSIAIAIVIDGWARVPVVAAPQPMPVAVQADLVVELPTHGYVEDVAAMYRGMTHGRPVVNGYSGWVPPHYISIQGDLRRDCVKSLESVRGGRSMDAVIWRQHASAGTIDTQLRQLWPSAAREETADVIVYRQSRSPAISDSAKTSCSSGTH